MPPFLVALAVAAGAIAGVRAIRREWGRVNRQLDEQEAARERRPPEPGDTLRRDPERGVWRRG